jgi:Predicted flavoprotein involved in K+ transport
VNIALNQDKVQEQKPVAHYDVIVLGAGPYGLSVAAHLSGRGLTVAIFGKPLSFWQHHMPQGMLLRSYWWATSLSDPQGIYTIGRYFQLKGITPPEPLPIELFIDYALWFQKNAVPNVDETYIQLIERWNDSYRVTLADGRVVTGSTVVMAPGLHYYQYIPELYVHLPHALVSHTGDYAELSCFKDQRVVIIGGGQAALESAALLHEQGAAVSVLVRHQLRWLAKADTRTAFMSIIHAIRAPQAGMGEGWLNVLLEKFPYLLQRTGRPWKNYVLGKMHGPAGSGWLLPRLIGKVHVQEDTGVVKAEAINAGTAVRLTLSDGTYLDVDHVLLGTGFRPYVKGLPMLSQDIKDALRTYRGSPLLNNWFESNVPGLYFVGFSSARSFGPFYRFVIGAESAAKRVSAAVAQRVRVTQRAIYA